MYSNVYRYLDFEKRKTCHGLHIRQGKPCGVRTWGKDNHQTPGVCSAIIVTS